MKTKMVLLPAPPAPHYGTCIRSSFRSLSHGAITTTAGSQVQMSRHVLTWIGHQAYKRAEQPQASQGAIVSEAPSSYLRRFSSELRLRIYATTVCVQDERTKRL